MAEETFTDASARIARAMSDRVMAAKVAAVRAEMSDADVARECDCRSIWCWLDRLTECRYAWICNRHDRRITGGNDEPGGLAP